jgi:hypothetical protein
MNNTLSPAENASDAWRMLTLEPLTDPNDPRYVDFTEARGVPVVRQLETKLRLHANTDQPLHLLFTGYRGDGKTTELYRLVGLIQDKYRPLYFHLDVEFELSDFELPDFLLGMATLVFDRMSELGFKLPDKLLDEVADWFASIVEIDETKTTAEVKAEAGFSIPDWFKFVTAKLLSTLKASGEQRKTIRRELNQRLPELLNYTRI